MRYCTILINFGLCPVNPNWSRRLIVGAVVDVLGHTLCSNEVKGHLRFTYGTYILF